MTKQKSTKRALLMSALSLLICVSMLIGSTFAWFTDSVTSGSNVITAGNLDIEVTYTLGDTDSEGAYIWNNLDGANDLFQKGLWEPGHTEVVVLRIENKGTLAAKYEAQMNIVDETYGKNKDGNDIILSDILTVETNVVGEDKQNPSNNDLALYVAFNWEEMEWLSTPVPFKSDRILNVARYNVGVNDAECTQILPGDAHYVVVMVDMDETVGNEANHDGVNVPSIEFGINVLATQYTYESDSFGNQYDKNAGYDYGKTNVGPYSLKVLSNGVASYDGATKTYTIAVDTVAQGGWNEAQGNYYAGYTVNVAGYDENATIKFNKDDGTEVIWTLANEEKDGFINNDVHQQWTAVGLNTAYRYDVDGDGVTDFTVINDASEAKVETATVEQLKKVFQEADGRVFLTNDIVYENTDSDAQLILEASGAISVDGNGKTITNLGADPDAGNHGYVGFVPPAGESVTLSNLNVAGSGFVCVGYYGQGGGTYELNNVNIIDFASTMKNGDKGFNLACAFMHYGNATLNNCVMTGTTAIQDGTMPVDLACANGFTTMVNGGEYGTIYSWSHAYTTINGAEVDTMYVAPIKGTVTIKAGSHIGTINIDYGTSAKYATETNLAKLVIEDGATIDAIVFDGMTYTLAEWNAR